MQGIVLNLYERSNVLFSGRSVRFLPISDLHGLFYNMSLEVRPRRRSRIPQASTGFLAQVKEVVQRYSKRTSPAHKRLVLLLLILGTLLRTYMVLQPITYDEARAYELVIGRSFIAIISDLNDPLDHVLHSVLARISTAILGIGTIQVRLPAFLASILAMPLFYLFVRAMFNRYIALMALALVAASAPLIEFSALAHGHAIVWFFFILALVLGRHFLQENDRTTATLLGCSLALAMWTMPSAIYPALTVYIWLLLYIHLRYEGSVRKRLGTLFFSMLVFAMATIALYMPIILEQGMGQIWHHPSLPERNWKAFTRDHQESVFSLWMAIADTTGGMLALLGSVAVIVTSFISSKFRVLVFAMLLGSVPLVLSKAYVPPAPDWFFTLFILHIGSAVALFYLLKFIQEKMLKELGKRTRTTVSAIALFALFTILGMPVIQERITRFPEAALAAEFLGEAIDMEGHVVAAPPWDAPVRFHAHRNGLTRDHFSGTPDDGDEIYVIVGAGDGGKLEVDLLSNRVGRGWAEQVALVKDWPRLEIFAARYRVKPPVTE